MIRIFRSKWHFARSLVLVRLFLFVVTAHLGFASEPLNWALSPNVCELLLQGWGNDYSPEEELESFWEHHPRFGIVKQNGRHYLVTKDEAMNLKLQNDIRVWRETLGETEDKNKPSRARRATLQEIGEGIVYDITDLLPKRARQMHERSTTRGNCWNFTCWNSGVVSGIFNMYDFEFTHWLSSPLARRIESEEALRPGDLIAFRATGKSAVTEIHGLTYVSEDLVFSKNGAGEGLFRLQDSREVAYLYGPAMKRFVKNNPIGTSAFRLRSLDEFVKEHDGELSVEVKAALSRLREAEAFATFHALDPDESENVESEDYQKRWRNSLKSSLAIYAELKPLVERALALNNLNASEEFLWKSIALRVSAPQ